MMNPIQVLLVEDNPADADITRDALESSKPHIELSIIADGAEALDFLRGNGNHVRAPRPDLVLLDLHLPKIDGKQVLAEVKKDPSLRLIPIVILTSSDAERDIEQSYELGANCYVTKPIDLKAFQTTVRAVNGFWFAVAKLPPSEDRRR